MIRIGKLTDYGILVLSQMSRVPSGTVHTASDLAHLCRLPAPTVSKLLKGLLQAGLLTSSRGVHGGYRLAKPPNEISVAEAIAALEGPMALTECSSEVPGLCGLEESCQLKNNWRIINRTIRHALSQLTLADMVRPLPKPPALGLGMEAVR